METQQNYNFTKREVDLIQLAIETHMNCLPKEDLEKVKNEYRNIVERLNLN